MAKSDVIGGRNIARWFRDTKRAASKKPPIIEVGFRDRRIAPLAAQLEFGNRETRLPERPAFRQSLDPMARAVIEHLAAAGYDFRRGLAIPDSVWIGAAIAARDSVRQAYVDFHGAPLSERQIERKAGTPFEDKELIGAEGPKLIGHIRAFVDGVEVG